MSETNYKKIATEGLWNNNPALVQLLGLCPLLAVSNSTVNALSLGIATVLVIGLSNLCVSIIRNKVTNEIRLAVFVMIIASVTTCIELIMQAFTFELYEILGIFIPLIVTNCAVLGRADGFAAKNQPIPSLMDGLMMGSGFALVLLTLGMVRELLGQGTLFSNFDLPQGPVASNWTLHIIDNPNYSFLFSVLPPGAFVIMGILIAAKNKIDAAIKLNQSQSRSDTPQHVKRIRVTDGS